MKNDNLNHQARQARTQRHHKTVVSQELLEEIRETIGEAPKRSIRKRQTNYAKKIMNDPLIMNA
jgi:hypothetical protein